MPDLPILEVLRIKLQKMKYVKYSYWDNKNNFLMERISELFEFLIAGEFLYTEIPGSRNVIFPLELINEDLVSGGMNAKREFGIIENWVPFALDKAQYDEIVNALINIDSKNDLRAKYHIANKFLFDPKINQDYEGFFNWYIKVIRKYVGFSKDLTFIIGANYPVYFDQEVIGNFFCYRVRFVGPLSFEGLFQESGFFSKNHFQKVSIGSKTEWVPREIDKIHIQDNYLIMRGLKSFRLLDNSLVFQPLFRPEEIESKSSK